MTIMVWPALSDWQSNDGYDGTNEAPATAHGGCPRRRRRAGPGRVRVVRPSIAGAHVPPAW